MQIAIDGPASAGKSTIAKIIAKKLNYVYTDTGAMYRSVTLLAQQHQLAYDDEAQIVQLMSQTPISFRVLAGQQHIFLGTQDVTTAIRLPAISRNVSQVASLKKVREILVQQQQKIAQDASVVMDGRDIGTVVLPQADIKIFLIASVTERAQRRYRENLTRGITTSLSALQAEIKTRDYKDSHRTISPLRKASDAIEVDTTGLNIAQVVTKVMEIIHQKLNS